MNRCASTERDTADLARELVDGPVASGIGVQQPQRLADVRVVEPGEPAALIGGQALHVLAQDLDEHQLGQPSEHGGIARTRRLGLR